MSVLIAGGGTGGHAFPGIALAEELRRRDQSSRIVFVGTAKGIEARAVPKAGFELMLLGVSGLRGKGLVQRLAGLLRLPLALFEAIRLVRRVKPQVAVSVGGYAAGPAVLAARLCGVPCVVMEQNVVAGLTNRLLGRLARHIIVALPVGGFQVGKVQQLGNPVRAEMVAVRELPYAPHRPMRLLVSGGSLGATAVNQIMMAAAPDLARLGLPIVHQTGQADAAKVEAAYRAAGLAATVMPFIDDMAKHYADADLVLCRAGATTVAELTVCGRPAVLVPFPFAIDDHQTANARVLHDAGAAIHLPQRELSVVRLLEVLRELSQDPQRLASMAGAARALGKPEAAARIADVISAEARDV
jgi:UDP-N-acetylglucosamine--N-acetylmuramyl-(pentapeptide) pyrophosphoryl-undecaprenol N-acetylglucosamine transferase